MWNHDIINRLLTNSVVLLHRLKLFLCSLDLGYEGGRVHGVDTEASVGVVIRVLIRMQLPKGEMQEVVTL